MSSSEEKPPFGDRDFTWDVDFDKLNQYAELIRQEGLSEEDVLAAEGEEDVLASQAKGEDDALEIAQLKAQRYKAKTDLIKKYANRLFWFMVGWAGLIILILFLAGGVFEAFFYFYLPQKVLITLVGATTIQVISLVASVAYYLYKSDKD